MHEFDTSDSGRLLMELREIYDFKIISKNDVKYDVEFQNITRKYFHIKFNFHNPLEVSKHHPDFV